MSVLLFISIVPVFLLALFIYSKDSIKEPASLLLGLFVSGFLAAVLVFLIDICITSVAPNFFVTDNTEGISFFKLFSSILLEIALLEEFCKWLMIKLIGYTAQDFSASDRITTGMGAERLKEDPEHDNFGYRRSRIYRQPYLCGTSEQGLRCGRH